MINWYFSGTKLRKNFVGIKLDKFIFLRDKIEKKYFIGMELDKYIFLRDEIERKNIL